MTPQEVANAGLNKLSAKKVYNRDPANKLNNSFLGGGSDYQRSLFEGRYNENDLPSEDIIKDYK